ncbi:hypothetical protein BDZ89DRAFT_966761 [Hymenopellis radicata]|nr:hypothetical protein BDZ89DRAFT_966761 [Hymenopellis radicata]
MVERDNIQQFLSYCHGLCNESRFIIASFPNAEIPAVEKVAHQLYAVRTIIHGLDDPYLSEAQRLWVDVQKDSLEAFRQVFLYMEQNGLFDKENAIHCLCIFLVYQPRIQASLNRAKHAWNHHKIRTARSKTPIAMYELSREKLIMLGVWTGDVGDDISCVDGFYGVEGAEREEEGLAMPRVDPNDPNSALAEDEDIESAREALGDFDFEEEDDNWGIDVYCRAVVQLHAHVCSLN